MKTKKPLSSLLKNQSGIASMVVVILIMTLLTLIVISMTKNSNREQQQALDRQLSTQAFYAAESGINDTKDYIVNPAGGPRPNKKDDCEGLGTANGTGNQFPGKNAQVGDFENTKYTCVLYNRTPTELRYFPVDVRTPTITPIEDAGGITINTLTFKWNQQGGGNNFAGCNLGSGIPKQIPSDCEAGMIRIELSDPASTNRQELINSTFVVYVKPSLSGSLNFSYDDAFGDINKQGAVTTGRCTTGGNCSITITSIEKDKLYLNLKSIYKLNDVTITGEINHSRPQTGTSILFRDAQMMVDSTGQAGDILKRVQVMVNLTDFDSGFMHDFAVQTSSDLCKKLEIRRDHSVGNGCP